MIAAVVACVVGSIGSAAPVAGQGNGEGYVDDDTLGGAVSDETPGQSGSSGSGQTVIVEWRRNIGAEQIGLPWYCNEGPDENAPWYWYDLVDVRTGETLDYAFRCYWGEGEEGPPLPPTVEEVLDSVDIPEPSIAVNPDPSIRGLTGLESWFWLADPETTVEVAVDLNGWTVDASLTADEWHWQIGDEGNYTATSPGSEEDPAASHTFDSKGIHTITVDTVWSGGWTLSYTPPGPPPPDAEDGGAVVADVGELDAETSSSLDYEVIEARTVVDEPEDD